MTEGTLPPAATRPVADDRLARRNVVVLATAQALAGAGAPISISLGGIVGYFLLGTDKTLATLPVTAFIVGTAVATLPAGVLARRLGRRKGLMTGSLIGICGGLLAALSWVVLSFLKFPPLVKQQTITGGRPLAEIIRQKRFVIAVLCAVSSYALMSFVMTAAPLAMMASGHATSDAVLGIQWHVLAMFGPSFFTGSLIQRFGKQRIVAAGLLLLAGSAALALSGLDLAHFWGALVVLGVGWNFGFIGATAMLTDTYRPEEKNRVQAVNDFIVFGFVAVASLSSGGVLNAFGWGTINLIVFPIVAIAFAMLFFTRERKPT